MPELLEHLFRTVPFLNNKCPLYGNRYRRAQEANINSFILLHMRNIVETHIFDVFRCKQNNKSFVHSIKASSISMHKLRFVWYEAATRNTRAQKTLSMMRFFNPWNQYFQRKNKNHLAFWRSLDVSSRTFYSFCCLFRGLSKRKKCSNRLCK